MMVKIICQKRTFVTVTLHYEFETGIYILKKKNLSGIYSCKIEDLNLIFSLLNKFH